ncbi:peroxide stress protein YaaA [Salinifilum ghardaiensis]
MLIVLPPSETKTTGGEGAPLQLESLSFPELNDARRALATELSTLAEDVPASLSALGISERQVDQVRLNAELWKAPTAPALERYTGVLYDALDVRSLDGHERGRADRRLAVASALFGLVRGTDEIPPYRMSADARLPGAGKLRPVWRPVLEPVLGGLDELVVDLRSGAYAALARVPAAAGVRVLSEDSRGERKVVSHHNKSYKGRLARSLAATAAEPATVDDLLDLVRSDGFAVEREGEQRFALIVR